MVISEDKDQLLEEVSEQLANINGILLGLFTYGLIQKNHPSYPMLNEISVKNSELFKKIKGVDIP